MSSEAVLDAVAPELSARSQSSAFKAAAAKMLVAFALADAHADERELAVVKRACEEFSIPAELFEICFTEASADPVEAFLSALIEIEDVEERELLAAFLFEVASADAVFHDREAEFLDLMHDAWGVSINFVNQPIRWDEEQRAVIEASSAEKLIVTAGPGMGKTAVACARVAHLIEKGNCADSNIWLVSFTRAAVAELKARIADFAEDPANVFAAKISTIDSKAWKVRYGFTEADAQKLFGGFETGIEDALKLMKERDDDFRDAFSGLEHVIIDEAQDITGPRAEFLLHLLSILPPECGVTVFHDPAQAIYDYALSEAGTRFVDALNKQGGWRPESLKKIYRTDDPALLRLYEDLRLDILGNTDAVPTAFERRVEIVRKAAAKVDEETFDYKKLPEVANALVLFRKRVEVLQASSFMAGAGVPHRLRMSGLPRTLQPWIGAAFSGCEARQIQKRDFEDLAIQAVASGADTEGSAADVFVDAQWDTLTRFGLVKRGELDLWAFRDRLYHNPPDEFSVNVLGFSGPVLGTIHASKGREADHVVLQINRHWGGEKGGAVDHDEEARVLFVGATRARQTLEVQGGFAPQFDSKTSDGRCYRRSRRFRSGVQTQIGLANDYDRYSMLSAKRGKFQFRDLLGLNKPFECNAVQQSGTWEFRIADHEGRELGWFTQAVNSGFFEICRKVDGIGRRPPEVLKHLHVMGWTTAVAPISESERLASIGTQAAKSGFWIAPQIVGFSTVFCRW